MSDDSSGRPGCTVGLIVLCVLAALAFWPRSAELKSADETSDVLNSLGVVWGRPGPPIVVFSNPG